MRLESMANIAQVRYWMSLGIGSGDFLALYRWSSLTLLSDTVQAFVAFAGSSYTFGITIFLVVGWAVAGAWVAGNALWQIMIQV